jgi:hypothetical protein
MFFSENLRASAGGVPPVAKQIMKTKRAIVITALVTLTIGFVVGCSTAGRGSAHEENVAFPFDVSAWKIGQQTESPSQRVVKFLARGEKMENWTELVTMQTFKKPAGDSEPLEIFYSRGAQRMSNDCPLSVWNVIARGEGSLLYEWKAQNCRGVVEQHEIGRFLDGKHNRFRLAYVKKVKTLSPEERDKWTKLLSDASIVTQ